MTFEEFFFKKKIDLVQFNYADEDLLIKFKNHFVQMGEKSFDHTKKYWFNNLRKKFPLSVEEEARLKELYAKPTEKPPVESNPVTETIVVSSEKPSGFKPKFKAAVLASKVEETEEKQPKELISKPVGFKPKFKAAQPPSVVQDQKEEDSTVVKPAGFKPRFKARSTALPKPLPTEVEENNNQETLPPKSITEEAKPLGFKPRFKAGTPSLKKEDENLSPSTDQVKDTETTANDKPVYKPRFKMNQVKKSED